MEGMGWEAEIRMGLEIPTAEIQNTSTKEDLGERKRMEKEIQWIELGRSNKEPEMSAPFSLPPGTTGLHMASG